MPQKLDAFNCVTAVASHLGRRCAAPALMGFDHVYADLLAGRSDAGAFAVASASNAASLVRRLDRLAAATAALYAELEALTCASYAPTGTAPWPRSPGSPTRRVGWRTPASGRWSGSRAREACAAC